MAEQMDVDKAPATSATTKGKENVTGTLSIALHPLVILTVSDHFTRSKLASDDAAFAAHARPDPRQRIVGAVLGTIKGREVEIYNCFEIIASCSGDDYSSIDLDFLRHKQEQFKKVYPDYEVLGWYTNGKEPRLSDIVVHKQMMTVTENPLLVLLDTAAAYASDTKELPMKVFESEVKVGATDGNVTVNLVPATYRIATVEAERIGVDHVAHSSTGTGGSQLAVHLTGMHGSIKMLNARVKILRSYVDRTLRGEIPFDHEIMRQIGSVCNMLPAIDTDEFRQRFISEYNDALLVTYLSTVTKAVNLLNDVTDKFAVASAGGRMMGPMAMAARHGFFA